MPLKSQKILTRLSAHPARPLNIQELADALNLTKRGRLELRKLVRTLHQQGQLVRHRNGRYSVSPPVPLTAGVLSAHPDGYGFVRTDSEKEPDIFIGPRSMAGALDGDRVEVQILAVKTDGAREGIIREVLERARSRIVGRFEPRADGAGFVVPQNPRIRHDISIAAGQTQGASAGEMVVAQLLTYPTRHRNPEGRILRVLGQAGDPAIDTAIVIEEYSLTHNFPAACLQEARRFPSHLRAFRPGNRHDLRDLKTVTIDGEQARDFDDAISIEQVHPSGPRKSRGVRYRLWVHIADVAHYVKRNSALDQEARRRGNSVYFPDAVVPMLPERLSNGLCSLNPGEDRLAMTVEMHFDAAGEMCRHQIYESIIRSDERMTYTGVHEILSDPGSKLRKRYANFLEGFETMQDLCQVLQKRRTERGSIDFDLPEPEIILDLQGQTVQILKEERYLSHRIIEEFMLAANETVAGHLTEQKVPMIYRVHDEPDPEKLLDFNRLLEGFGLALKKIQNVKPRSLQRILKQARGKPWGRLVHTMMLRSMKQARYAASRSGHFGLATNCYTHFTSPIRRYSDLVVHDLLKSTLRKRAGTPRRETGAEAHLVEVARVTSARERVAVEAERKAVDIKKARFMVDKIGQVFSGHISGVLSIGFFVELENYFVEGLVPVASMTDDYYIYQEAQHGLLGVKKKKLYRLGDPVRVRVENVDLIRFRVNLMLAHLKSPSRSPGTPRKSRRRRSRANTR